MLKKKKRLKKRQKLIYKPDYLYASYWMLKFANKFMKSGKKHIVEKHIFNGLSIVKEKTRQNTLFLFFQILIKFRPSFGFVLKRFAKQFKTIPVPLYPRRQTITSLTWLVSSIRVNTLVRSFQKRLVTELVDFKAGKKTSLVKRYQTYLQELNTHRLNHRFRWK